MDAIRARAGERPSRRRRSTTPSRSRRPGLRASLIARLRASSLNRQLAAGVATWQSPAHAARALQLTSARHRSLLADALDRVASTAMQQPMPRLSAAIPPCRVQVRVALPELLAMSSRLRDPRPVAAKGVARLHELICDGAGPCYVRSNRDVLRDALLAVELEILD